MPPIVGDPDRLQAMTRNAALFAPDVPGLGPDVVAGEDRRCPCAADLLAAARFLLAGVLMLAWAGRDAVAVPRSAHARLLATALLVNTGNYALLFWGIARAPTGLSAIVNFATIPVFSLLASHWLEGEPIARRHLAAIALGTLGLALLFATRALGALGTVPAAAAELWGLAAIALGTLLYCVGAVLSRPIAATMPVLALAGWQTLIGGIGLGCRVAGARAGRGAALARARELADLAGAALSRRRRLARGLHDLHAAAARLGCLPGRALRLRQPGDRGRRGRRRAVRALRLGRRRGAMLMFGAAATALRKPPLQTAPAR